MAIWSCLRPFGMFYGPPVYFPPFWYVVPTMKHQAALFFCVLRIREAAGGPWQRWGKRKSPKCRSPWSGWPVNDLRRLAQFAASNGWRHLSLRNSQRGKNGTTAIPQTTFPRMTFPQTTFPQTTFPQTTFPQTTFHWNLPKCPFPKPTFPQTTFRSNLT
jgi:hypothetical protein